MHELLYGHIRMEVCSEQFRLGTDSMALADFCRIRPGSCVLDLGCGCGALGLLLLGADPTLRVMGLELQPEAAGQADKNVRENGLSERMTVVCGDLRDPSAVPASGFDAVVCNPPYFPSAAGKTAAQEARRVARTELQCTLADVCRAAARALRWGGRCFLVHKPDRLADLVCALRGERLEPKRIRFVRHRPDTSVSLMLTEARLGGRPGLEIQQDLILFLADGSESPEYQRIYHR